MNHLSSEEKTLLILLQKSLWGEAAAVPFAVSWEEIDNLAAEQGVVSLVYDGAVKAGAAVPQELLRKWKDKMFRGAVKNELLLHAQKQLTDWLAEAGIPVVILKGSSVARYYPQPELRVLGDIDLLVREEDLERAAELLQQHGYAVHESDHDFHVGLSCRGVYVELHYGVTGFPDSPGGCEAREYAARFLDEIHYGVVADYTFPVLSEANQALSLLLHMIRHMFSTGLGLRQVCDWAVYVANADSERFAAEVIPMFRRCGLLRYARVATRACVRYLGLPEEGLSWCADVDDADCRVFMEEVFRLGNMGEADNEGMGNMLITEKTMGTHETAVQGLLARLTELAYHRFPLTRKWKLFLPVFWVYLPVRYLVRSVLGLRPKKSVVKVVLAAKKQRSLYEVLRPYEEEV